MREPWAVVLSGSWCCALSVPAHAQEAGSVPDASATGVLEEIVQKPDGPPPTPEHTGIKAMLKGLLTDFEHLPTAQNALIAGVGGGLALAGHPADYSVNAHLVGSPWVHEVFVPGETAGASPTLFGVAAIIYAVGRIQDEPKVSTSVWIRSGLSLSQKC